VPQDQPTEHHPDAQVLRSREPGHGLVVGTEEVGEEPLGAVPEQERHREPPGLHAASLQVPEQRDQRQQQEQLVHRGVVDHGADAAVDRLARVAAQVLPRQREGRRGAEVLADRDAPEPPDREAGRQPEHDPVAHHEAGHLRVAPGEPHDDDDGDQERSRELQTALPHGEHRHRVAREIAPVGQHEQQPRPDDAQDDHPPRQA
jgi:hypothetical protein